MLIDDDCGSTVSGLVELLGRRMVTHSQRKRNLSLAHVQKCVRLVAQYVRIKVKTGLNWGSCPTKFKITFCFMNILFCLYWSTVGTIVSECLLRNSFPPSSPFDILRLCIDLKQSWPSSRSSFPTPPISYFIMKSCNCFIRVQKVVNLPPHKNILL